MIPGYALTGLRAALAAHGITTTGMTLTRLSGTLYPAHGPNIGYHHGLYWWPARRPHRARPLYAIHDARDPPGAARRIAQQARLGTSPADNPHMDQPPDPVGRPETRHRATARRRPALSATDPRGDTTMPDTSRRSGPAAPDAASFTSLISDYGGLWELTRKPRGFRAQRRPLPAHPVILTAETVPALRELLEHGYDPRVLAAIFRDHHAAWQIEQLDPGSAWLAISRDPCHTQVITAADLPALRHKLSRDPAEPLA
jgi:hypothetical protein